MKQWMLVLCSALAVVAVSNVVAEEDVVETVEETLSYDPTATPSGEFALLETFQKDPEWVNSARDQYNGEVEYSVVDGLEGDLGMELPAKARHYGVSKPVADPVDPSEGLVFQYEITLKNGWECGGGYFKLLSQSDDLDLEALEGSTPYTVMFGPDKCGSTNKVHLILRHKSPSGKIEEKHLTSPPTLAKIDSLPHLYTLVLKPDNSYKVLVDMKVVKEGSLFEDFSPSINPPKEIDDPKDFKPADWVDEASIPDPTAEKPEDWDEDAPKEIEDAEAEKPEGWKDDEPETIDDPEAEKPEDWDDEEDGDWDPPKIANPACADPGCGEWTRPMIPNPEYKGKWSAPMIDNPEYKGPWEPRKIPNPDYFNDEEPLKSIGKVAAVALEVWQMSDGIVFDNVLLTSSEEIAEEYARKTWSPRSSILTKASEEAKEAESDTAGFSTPEWVNNLLAHPLVESVHSTVQPLLDTAAEKIEATIGFVAFGIITVLFTVVSCYCVCSSRAPQGSAEATPVAVAKKEDITGEDDAQEQEQEIAEEEEVVEKKPTRRKG